MENEKLDQILTLLKSIDERLKAVEDSVTSVDLEVFEINSKIKKVMEG
jgi:hypothetical protein